MKKTGYLLCSVFFLLSVMIACEREPRYPIIPEIEFVSIREFESVDTINFTVIKKQKVEIVFHFQDGDGDIGLNAADIHPPFDTTSQYYYNLFIDLYERRNGEFVLYEPESPLHQRIPRLSSSVPESIEGEVTLHTYPNTLSSFDTIYYEISIVDRELHHSNTIKTPSIIVTK